MGRKPDFGQWPSFTEDKMCVEHCSGWLWNRRKPEGEEKLIQMPHENWIIKMYKKSGSPDGSVGKESTCHAGDPGWISGSGRSPGEGKGYPLQYSGLENSMDCIMGVSNSWTWLSDFHKKCEMFPFLLNLRTLCERLKWNRVWIKATYCLILIALRKRLPAHTEVKRWQRSDHFHAALSSYNKSASMFSHFK